MLVVIGIISVCIMLVLPTMWSGRKSAKATIGVANMRSLTQVLMSYTNDNKEYYLNPFRAEWPKEFPGGAPKWTEAVCETDPELRWDFDTSCNVEPKNHPYFDTDGFALLWASFLADYRNTARVSPDQFSPADGDLLDLYQDVKDTPDMRGGRLLFPSSFAYSMTFWCKPERFPSGQWRRDMAPEFLRNHQIASVTYPSQKVMVWSGDFSIRLRGVPAVLHASMADGSYRAIGGALMGEDPTILPPSLTDLETMCVPPGHGPPCYNHYAGTANGIKGKDIPGS
jgi:type II secretory pathway pseudopilin PulG